MDTEQEVRIAHIKSAKKYELAYMAFSYPDMKIHEDASLWLSGLGLRSSHTHQRNSAYGISHWLNYCSALDLDYRRACLDDLISYKQAMASHVSQATKQRLSSGTIAQRLRIVCSFYQAGINNGWYLTYSDLAHKTTDNWRIENHSVPIDISGASLAPRKERASTDIRPFSPPHLIAFLDELAPSDYLTNSRSQRDRLVSEWLVFCGVRIHEILGSETVEASNGLTVNTILDLKTNTNNPFDHAMVKIIGKFSKSRNIAVPFWLIIKTKHYISTERAEAISGCATQSDNVFVNGLESGANRGKRLSIRRYQAIFAENCQKCELTRLVKKWDANYGNPFHVPLPMHSPHDLRHTYAVITYHAEVENKNSEPWKIIQAQMGHSSLQTTIDTYLSFVSVHGQWRDIRRVSVRELAGIDHE